MDEFIRLLTIDGVTPVGMALTGFALFVAALWREWIVSGKRWQAKVTECGELASALKLAHAELKSVERDYIDARINLARYEEREQARTGTTIKRRPRETS